MLILMKPASNPDAVAVVCRAVEELGLVPHPIPGATRVAIGVTGNTGPVDETPIRGLPGVVDVKTATQSGLDAKARAAFVKPICDQLFVIFDFGIRCIGRMMRGPEWSDYSLRVPVEYDLRYCLHRLN